jgi:hypothetical protein
MVPKTSPTATKLSENIYASILQYLQTYMVTLHLLPNTSSSSNATSSTATMDTVGSASGGPRAALDLELSVIETQMENVRALLEDAGRRRRLEDAASLREALEDLEAEAGRVRKEISQL